MTQQVPARRPLANDIFFKTMRELHPSRRQLEDLEVVEKQAHDRLVTKEPNTLKGRKQNQPNMPLRKR